MHTGEHTPLTHYLPTYIPNYPSLTTCLLTYPTTLSILLPFLSTDRTCTTFDILSYYQISYLTTESPTPLTDYLTIYLPAYVTFTYHIHYPPTFLTTFILRYLTTWPPPYLYTHPSTSLHLPHYFT
jgi:hypothetical protein